MNRNLLRIDQDVTYLDGKKAPEMGSTLWVDEYGQILKTFTDSEGGMTTYRTTKEAALRNNGPKVDLIAVQMVKLARKINNPESTRRSIIYKVTLANGDALAEDLPRPTVASPSRRGRRADARACSRSRPPARQRW